MFVYRSRSICEWALKVDNHGIGLTKYGIDTSEEGGDAFALSVRAHPSIQQHITSEDEGQRVLLSCFLLEARNKKSANSQSYTD